AEIRACSRELAIGEKLIGAEGVRFLAPPPQVPGLRPFLARPDAVGPVVGVRKAAARPANNRRVNLLERFDGVFAEAVVVRNGRIRPHPHAAINAAAEMLGEVAQYVRVERPERLVRDHRHARAALLRPRRHDAVPGFGARGHGRTQGPCAERPEKSPPVHSPLLSKSVFRPDWGEHPNLRIWWMSKAHDRLWLLVSQGLYGIEPRGARGGIEAGEQAHDQRKSDGAQHQPPGNEPDGLRRKVLA